MPFSSVVYSLTSLAFSLIYQKPPGRSTCMDDLAACSNAVREVIIMEFKDIDI